MPEDQTLYDPWLVAAWPGMGSVALGTGKKPRLEAADRQHIEQLFTEAARNRSRAYFLKQELDRLHVFPDYEDRFLDLFKEPGPP